MASAAKEKPPVAPIKAGGLGEGIGEPDKLAPAAAPAPAPAPPETYGGRQPKVGDMVYLWESIDLTPGAKDSALLRPVPAMLFEKTMMGWNINIFKFGHIHRRGAVRWSDKPAMGCWTWKD